MTKTTGSRLSVLESQMESQEFKIQEGRTTMLDLVKVTAQLAITVRLLAWMFGISFPVVITSLVYMAFMLSRGAG